MNEYYHSEGQEWIICPECGSEDAGIIHWADDREITMECPDCENKQWGVEWTMPKRMIND